ncbi:tetratricopeptide repeat protein [Lutibacter sp. Hel_I_33_5]|nr:tetratricopeptide repeat protein [Lutibacter sp. Hel_I_33_5]
MLGENYYRQGEYEKATQIYKTLYDKSPYNTTYLKRLISCYQETDDFLLAEKLLQKRLKRQPTLTYLNVLLGYNFERQQKKELANQYYNNAINSISKNPSYGGIVGRMFKDYNLLDQAVSVFKKTMVLNPNADYNFQIAQIYGEQGKFEEMFNSYVDLVDKNPKNVTFMKRFASKYITEDAQNETNTLLKKALLRKAVSKPKNVWNELLSWLFAQQKDYGKAFNQEKAIYQRDKGDLSKISELGLVAFDNLDYDATTKCFSYIIENTTFIEEKVEAHLYLLKVAIAKKDDEVENKFKTVFKQFGENTNTINLQSEYADYLTFEKNEPLQAKKVLNKALKLTKNKFQKAKIKLKLGDVLVFTGKFNKALIYFSQIQTQLKNHPLAQEARFKVAQTSYFKGDFKWAKTQLKILKGSTTQLIANDAADLFLTITDNEPIDSIPSGLKEFAQADLFSYQNKNQEAMVLLDTVLSKYKGMPIESKSHFNKGKLFVKSKQYDLAISSFEKTILADQTEIFKDDVYYQMAELYNYHLNNPEKAKEYYQKIIFEHPSSIYLVDARKKFRKLRGDTI